MAHVWLFGTIVFGLAASVSWGAGDFSGGLASRRAQVFSVVLAAYLIGLIMLTVLAFAWAEPFPSWRDMLWGAIAGLVGTVGLTAFYRSLAVGRMGINAPIAAVLSAALPVIFNAFSQGLPPPIQVSGFVLALLAVALVSRPERAAGRPAGLGLAVLAGMGFGGFFILIDQVSAHAVFWPLAAARFASVIFMFIFVRVMRQEMLPKKSVLPLVLVAGILDVLGNVFFVLATHSGRLDVAAILSSLYPAVTVLLAAIVLRERVSRIQGVGVLLAVVSVLLISA